MPIDARYNCQVILPGFGHAAQQRIAAARVLIIGAGGLGCPAAQYLAAAGVGTIGIADHDTVSVTNLHRQILYTPAEQGLKKAIVAAQKLSAQNPGITIVPHDVQVDHDNMLTLAAQYDVILDCTDNFDARYLINDAGVLTGRPVVYGAIYQYEGQVAVWNVPLPNGARSINYRDVYPDVDAAMVPDCAVGGVMPTLAGIIGCMQATEALKYITGTGTLLAGRMLLLDTQTMQSRIIKMGATTTTHITSLPAQQRIPTLSYTEYLANAAAYHLIDVRTTAERTAHHIGGQHIPLTELHTRLQELPTALPLLFYCASGKRSAQAVKLTLTHLPTITAFSLSGGLKDINPLLSS